MESDGSDLLVAPRVEPIRLRTIILLRWVAIAGQLAAVAAAAALGVQVRLGAVLAVIAAAAVVNLAATRRSRQQGGGHESALQLGFDIAQLTALLALTGGLSNPFAMFITVPVTIAATALDRRRVLLLALATVALISLAGVVAAPLTREGAVIAVPSLLAFGHWVAIVVAVIFASAYALRVSGELRASGAALAATQMALAREQKLQHLGGVVAAAAHEMGTPLATIKLVAGELIEELAASPLAGREDIAADLALLRDSADRCRDILRGMGSAGRDDLLVQSAPLSALLAEAAEPHGGRGRRIETRLTSEDGSPEPVLRRDPGVVHALRNIIQNAVDFAATAVTIEAHWNRANLRLSISDDGPGYPPALLSRIGDPFLTARRNGGEGRAGYEGMGLGLFIAKTLLERSGAELQFANLPGGGALVQVGWPRDRINATSRQALGMNPLIEA